MANNRNSWVQNLIDLYYGRRTRSRQKKMVERVAAGKKGSKVPPHKRTPAAVTAERKELAESMLERLRRKGIFK